MHRAKMVLTFINPNGFNIHQAKMALALNGVYSPNQKEPTFD